MLLALDLSTKSTGYAVFENDKLIGAIISSSLILSIKHCFNNGDFNSFNPSLINNLIS